MAALRPSWPLLPTNVGAHLQREDIGDRARLGLAPLSAEERAQTVLAIEQPIGEDRDHVRPELDELEERGVLIELYAVGVPGAELEAGRLSPRAEKAGGVD